MVKKQVGAHRNQYIGGAVVALALIMLAISQIGSHEERRGSIVDFGSLEVGEAPPPEGLVGDQSPSDLREALIPQVGEGRVIRIQLEDPGSILHSGRRGAVSVKVAIWAGHPLAAPIVDLAGELVGRELVFKVDSSLEDVWVAGISLTGRRFIVLPAMVPRGEGPHSAEVTESRGAALIVFGDDRELVSADEALTLDAQVGSPTGAVYPPMSAHIFETVPLVRGAGRGVFVLPSQPSPFGLWVRGYIPEVFEGLVEARLNAVQVEGASAWRLGLEGEPLAVGESVAFSVTDRRRGLVKSFVLKDGESVTVVGLSPGEYSIVPVLDFGGGRGFYPLERCDATLGIEGVVGEAVSNISVARPGGGAQLELNVSIDVQESMSVGGDMWDRWLEGMSGGIQARLEFSESHLLPEKFIGGATRPIWLRYDREGHMVGRESNLVPGRYTLIVDSFGLWHEFDLLADGVDLHLAMPRFLACYVCVEEAASEVGVGAMVGARYAFVGEELTQRVGVSNLLNLPPEGGWLWALDSEAEFYIAGSGCVASLERRSAIADGETLLFRANGRPRLRIEGVQLGLESVLGADGVGGGAVLARFLSGEWAGSACRGRIEVLSGDDGVCELSFDFGGHVELKGGGDSRGSRACWGASNPSRGRNSEYTCDEFCGSVSSPSLFRCKIVVAGGSTTRCRRRARRSGTPLGHAARAHALGRGWDESSRVGRLSAAEASEVWYRADLAGATVRVGRRASVSSQGDRGSDG
ncbi:hypothetical protein Pla163_10960 [Planctomycetes bacterium Pla163]|uniref:Uncharacterized protein n=1 Tax=Rohdeia mirabilis TaxID=2528008 RepID=A0A518CXP8_9BACT|nr:hypothetical protein Pla163_10960 [Planctomycetes bacterium Pla163]